ncbi:MAG: hypothetical protein MnENMB40S_00930 [Rhizobiaceae bacterium MnEN-MB40S]|nr:MAG: hypothetical protein MnENMB40S_00930 [Rhizobiaceae bacterium MnEN-MB40S]
MTISTTESRIRYSGDGATTAFSFPYFFEQESHLSVYLTDEDGLETLQTIAVHYTVAGEETSSGVVTFLEAPLATDTVTIIRDEPLTQATEVSDIGTFRAQAFESQFDRFARALQTLDGRIRRAAKVKASSGNTEVVLPEPEAKALLRWDDSAADLENGPTALDIENAEANAAIASQGADVALAASVEAAAHASSIAVKFFASRDLAEATAISDFTQILLVSHNGRALRYVEDAEAATPALTTADGRLWVPADEFITFDHFGAVADNATDCSAAMQSAIDYAAGFANGGTVYGLAGQYALASSLSWMPKVSFSFEDGFHLRATAVMVAMFEGLTGDDLPKRVFFKGGKIDANYLAERIIYFHDYKHVHISDFEFVDCDGNYIHLGSNAGTQCGEAIIHDGLILREPGNPFDGDATQPKGIHFDFPAPNSDCLISDLIIKGCWRGIAGEIYSGMFARVHCWSYPSTDGEMETAFRITGNQNVFVECYADDCALFGFYFDGEMNVLTNSTVNLPDNGLTTETAVYLESGSSLTAKNNVFHCYTSDNQIVNGFAGDTSKLVAEDNVESDVENVFGNQGLGKAEVHVSFTTNTGADPTILTSTNVESITRHADWDFAINFDRDMVDTDYQILVDTMPSSYPSVVIPVIRGKNDWNVRVQFVDETGAYVEPASVTVTVLGTISL